ncbi:MAG: hypothetical protein WC054_14960, partial [Candidatus Nanopelagicales bacterium]
MTNDVPQPDQGASELAVAAPPVDLQAEYDAAVIEHNQLRKTSMIGGVLSIAILIAIALMPVPYVKLSPGPMFNTIGEVDGVDLIRITGTQVYPTTGELNLTTVTERGG